MCDLLIVGSVFIMSYLLQLVSYKRRKSYYQAIRKRVASQNQVGVSNIDHR